MSFGLGMGFNLSGTGTSVDPDAFIYEMFAANEPGVIYDFTDTSTLYQGNEGTTSTVVNSTIGIALDKRLRMALGSNIPSLTTLALAGTATVEGSGVRLTGTGISNSVSAPPDHIVVGRRYEVIITVNNNTGSVVLRGGLGTIVPIASGQSGTYRGILVATTTAAPNLTTHSSTVTDALVTEFSIREVAGNHASQTVSASRPLLRGTPTGSPMWPAADWAAGTGWSIAGGTATGTATTGAIVASAGVPPVAGRVYRFTYTVTVSAGQVTLTCGSTAGVARTASGTYTEYLTAASGSKPSFTGGGGGFTGTVNLASMEVYDSSPDVVAAPYWASFDGTDDSLATAAIDFTGTAVMTVVCSVRKSSDSLSSNGEICGIGALAGNGTFHMMAAGGTAPNYEANCRGTVACSLRSNGPAAPSTDVLSAVFNLAGATRDEAVVAALNGGAWGSTGGSIGPPGGGNFSNLAFNMGRDGASARPFLGRIYRMIVIGRALTADELAAAEAWCAEPIGITLP